MADADAVYSLARHYNLRSDEAIHPATPARFVPHKLTAAPSPSTPSPLPGILGYAAGGKPT